jgi:putative transposase
VGTCKIHALMRADGYNVFVSTVERRCGGGTCYSPRECQAERRELAKTRKAAFAEPPTGANQVRQLDFTEFETITGGLWRIAGCGGLLLEFGWHLAKTCNALGAITAVQAAMTEADRLGARSWPSSSPTRSPARSTGSSW